MRGRYKIICYQKHLKEYSIGTISAPIKLCLRFLFFSLKLLCDYISAFQTETDRSL